LSYSRTIQIEFNHCDPAGIVFYPRYYEMVNSVVENFFAEELGYPFSRIVIEEGCGVPTVHVASDFSAPSWLGEKVEFALRVVKVGARSVGFAIDAAKGGESRMTTHLTLVWINAKGRAEPWPELLHARLLSHLEGQNR
jgi:4-hydroxybenzoyl-CoA thioesterase